MPGPARARLHWLLRPLLWALLGAWAGALLLFGAVVARAVFATGLPPGVAGELVGRVLGPLQLAGAGAGLALAALGGLLGRGRAVVVLPLLLAAACLLNHYGVSPAVAAIHLTDPSAGPDAGARFARLHQLSVLLFCVVAGGVVLLGVLHGARERREEAGEAVGPRPR